LGGIGRKFRLCKRGYWRRGLCLNGFIALAKLE
jgi:hypothetical protein